jgi:hypothetical protein
MTDSANTAGTSTRRRSPWQIALAMFVLIAVFAVLREHWAHVAGYWPYLLLLACPLMHVFGHKHGGHNHD